MPTPETLKPILLNVDIVALLACRSSEFLQKLQMKGYGIGFSSVVEDGASAAFAAALFDYMQMRFEGKTKIDPEGLFDYAVDCYQQKYKIGDPEKFLHSASHAHTYHPEPGCEQCHPPVHGIPCLYKYDKGIATPERIDEMMDLNVRELSTN
jgi:hypothetical protein